MAYHSHQGRGTPLCSSFQERRSRGRNAEIFSSASCKNSSQAPYHVPRSRSSVPTSLELGDYVAYKQVDCVEDFNIVHSLQILVTPLNCTGGCHIFGMASTVSRVMVPIAAVTSSMNRQDDTNIWLDICRHWAYLQWSEHQKEIMIQTCLALESSALHLLRLPWTCF